jgi:hypothetical protein
MAPVGRLSAGRLRLSQAFMRLGVRRTRDFVVFLVICRLLRKLFRRQSPWQWLPSACCLDHLLDRISCRLGMFALPQQSEMGCTFNDAMNAIRGEPGELSIDLGQTRLVSSSGVVALTTISGIDPKLVTSRSCR